MPDTPQGVDAGEKRRGPYCDQAAAERGERLRKKTYSEATIAAFLKYDKLTDVAREIGVTPQTAANGLISVFKGVRVESIWYEDKTGNWALKRAEKRE